MKTKKLVIVGDSAFAEIAYEYFDADTEYEVTAFSVESKYLEKDKLHNLPIVPFENLRNSHPPEKHEIYVATVYTQLNRLRARLAKEAKAKGYKLASYISPHAFVWRNVEIGEHCFIFENNTVQPFVKVGDNVVMWSGNHIGHHSVIGDNCFISSHVVISGFCNIGANTFMGVNSTISNNVSIGKDNWLGPNTVVTKDCESDTLFKPDVSQPAKIPTSQLFKVKK